jgi:hypothetical protein
MSANNMQAAGPVTVPYRHCPVTCKLVVVDMGASSVPPSWIKSSCKKGSHQSVLYQYAGVIQ